MAYQPSPQRYDTMQYRRTGRSGLLLPALSLGLWHNFGDADPLETSRALLRRAFDLGITHFDLANNYGPPPGAAEKNAGRILREDFAAHRDELILSSKAGYEMGPGPYADAGSRKYLLSSLDQSLQRLGLDYVDIFYHHRPDPETPLDETMGALDQAVRSGKALYAGISNYNADQSRQAAKILRDLGTPCLINQVRYSLYDRHIEPDELLDALDHEGVGCIVFSPLAKGLLTNRYLEGIPADSRAARPSPFLTAEQVEKTREISRRLNDIARERGQSLAQMALAWTLRDSRVTSTLIGVSRVSQLDDDVAALDNLAFTDDELARIEATLSS